jgi:hypothetical protein
VIFYHGLCLIEGDLDHGTVTSPILLPTFAVLKLYPRLPMNPSLAALAI